MNGETELKSRLTAKTRENMLEVFSMLGDYCLPERSHILERFIVDEKPAFTRQNPMGNGQESEAR